MSAFSSVHFANSLGRNPLNDIFYLISLGSFLFSTIEFDRCLRLDQLNIKYFPAFVDQQKLKISNILQCCKFFTIPDGTSTCVVRSDRFAVSLRLLLTHTAVEYFLATQTVSPILQL